jgi:mannan endo-1,4-beta-mannosidase
MRAVSMLMLVSACSGAPGRRSAGDAATTTPGRDASAAADAGERVERSSFYVEGRSLHDACGERVVLRGVNHPTIFVDRSARAFPEIARTGANAVRIFWIARAGVPIGEAETAIGRAEELGMIPILELHDSTCEWNLEPLLDYWTSPEAVALIERHRRTLIVNIANEASAPDSDFVSGYSSAIARLRSAGIHVPLMIDANRCGRNYRALLDGGRALLDADPDHNLLFSVHLWDPLEPAEITAFLERSIELDLPLVIGEFANREPPGCGRPIAYTHLIEEAQRLGIGWLAWSWGDDAPATPWNSDCAEFDMTRTFAFDSLERWGLEVAVTHPASIANTAVRPRSMTAGRCE